MNKTLLIGIAVVVIVGASVFMLIRPNSNDSPGMSEMDHSSMSNDSLKSSTYEQYAALKGEDYDRMFLANMIVHHQGAVDMARLALSQAGHDELKAFAQRIIDDQTKEIGEMTAWQKEWGYPAASGENMTDHSAMDMTHEMTSMTGALNDLSGNSFDKKFLELMIEHHQSAIDMARPGETNAQHQQVKDLTKSIISTQTNEIEQMRKWQKDWNL